MGGLKLWRELIAASLAVLLVLFAIDRVGLGKDLLSELLIVTRGMLGSIRAIRRSRARGDLSHLAPVHGHTRRRAATDRDHRRHCLQPGPARYRTGTRAPA